MLPRRRADLSFRDVDGETVVLDRRLGKVHQLNRTASYVWQRCDGRTELREIIASLAQSYGGEPGDVEGDVGAVMAKFEELGLLETQEVGASNRNESGVAGSEESS
jgi:PqqD family protein of HPr-rel-A system